MSSSHHLQEQAHLNIVFHHHPHWDQSRSGDDEGWPFSKPGAGALWTPQSSRQRLSDLQANSSQTCQSRDPGLFGLARVQQGRQSSAFLKFKKLTTLAARGECLSTPYFVHKCECTQFEYRLRGAYNSCPISHQTGDLYGLEVCCWQ